MGEDRRRVGWWMVTVSLTAAAVGVLMGWTLESCDEEQQAVVCGVTRAPAVAVRLPRAFSPLLLQISASLFPTSKAGFEIAPEEQSQILLAAFPNWLLCCQSDWLLCQTVFHQVVWKRGQQGAWCWCRVPGAGTL